MWLPFFSAAVGPPDPPDDTERCPFYVAEDTHDERALEGRL